VAVAYWFHLFTMSSRVIREKLIVSQLVKKFPPPFTESESPFPCLQEFDIGLNSEPDKSFHIVTPFFNIRFNFRLPSTVRSPK